MIKQIPQGYKNTTLGVIPSDWQVVRLGDVLKIGSGRDYKHLHSGSIPVYGTGGYMLSVNEYLYDGESVCIGRKGTIDKPMLLSGKFWTIDTLFYTHSFKNAIPAYIYLIFLQISWQKYNEASGVPSLSKSTIEAINIILPSIKEQQQIAEILLTWDDCITTQEQLIEQKKLFKKGLMQQLFSQKLRFKDEDGNDYPHWQEKKLGDICKIKKGEQLSKLNMIDNGLYPVLNGGVTYSGYTNIYNVDKATIAISEGGNSCGFVNFIKYKFWSGGHCYTLQNLAVETLFLYNWLKFNEFDIMSLRVGSGLPNIQKKTLENFKCNFSIDFEEQQKIGNLLSLIDDEIRALTKELEHIKLQKKALMQKLLTGQVRVKI